MKESGNQSRWRENGKVEGRRWKRRGEGESWEERWNERKGFDEGPRKRGMG